ncbi:MAG TPA: hypothetical protein VNK03_05555 [Gammaproteobacteria bacterium]|nr:hypothetical protein [Gammaproteobacteria bacterium]
MQTIATDDAQGTAPKRAAWFKIIAGYNAIGTVLPVPLLKAFGISKTSSSYPSTTTKNEISPPSSPVAIHMDATSPLSGSTSFLDTPMVSVDPSEETAPSTLGDSTLSAFKTYKADSSSLTSSDKTRKTHEIKGEETDSIKKHKPSKKGE